jgi:outer membrane protein assembly factor BamB
MPIGIILVATILLTLVWLQPAEESELGGQVFVTLFIGAPALFLIAVWWTFLSRVRWRWRILSYFVVITLLVGLASQIQRFEITAEHIPLIEFKWTTPRETVLAQHRQKAQAASEGVQLHLDVSSTGANDVAEFRGARRDGVVAGPPLSQDWVAKPPRQLWRQPIGGGCAGFLVVGQGLITAEQRGDQEAIVCYDKETGHEYWVYSYPAHFSSTGGDGPRATPTFAQGRVYAIGAEGHLVCLNAGDGQLVWAVDVFKETQDKNQAHGLAGSPLVFDQVVVVTPGMQERKDRARGVLAYHAETGELLWGAGNRPGAYASPVLAELAGRRQIVVLDAQGLVGYEPETGRQLWDFPFADVNQSEFNIAQPLVLSNDRVFVCSAAGAAVAQIKSSNDTFTAESVWRGREPDCVISAPVEFQDHVYGLCRGILACFDLQNGNRVWKKGRYRNGQILRYDDLLLIQSEGGDLALVRPTPNGYQELTRTHVLDGDKAWNCPAISAGLIYVRNNLEMACYDLRPERGQVVTEQ